MRPWRVRLAVLGVGAAIAAASSPTLSAWTAATSNPAGTVSAIPDWTPPAIQRAVIQKTQGGKPNYLRAGGTYRLCAQVATTDTGNPASGIPAGNGWVQTSLTNLTSTLVGLLTPGTTTAAPCLGTDNRVDAQRTVTLGTPEGTRQVTLTARDNAGNVRTNTIDVTIDNTRPTAAEFSTVNKPGGTAGLIENGDKAVFRYSEPIDPHSILPNWDGQATNVTAAVIDGTTAGELDKFAVYRYQTSTQIPLTKTAAPNYVALKANYVPTASPYYSSMDASMRAVGDTIEITLGTPTPADTGAVADIAANRTATTWHLQAGLYDFAGGTLSSTASVTEPGTADIEF